MSKSQNDTALSSAPPDDIELVSNYFNDKCNCYSYAVQDYLAGHLSKNNNDDFNYLPRPGQSRGNTYTDIIGENVKGMQRAVCEDGLRFAGMKYPQRIPQGFYVICCFLEPAEYHFIRQNNDGSWSSKNGREPPTKKDAFGEDLKNPEEFYHNDPKYKFVGYFFVPEGGINVGVRAYEQRRLLELNKTAKRSEEKTERDTLLKLTSLSNYGNNVVKKIREIFQKKEGNVYEKIREVWEKYLDAFAEVSSFCADVKYDRKKALKAKKTRKKNALQILKQHSSARSS